MFNLYLFLFLLYSPVGQCLLTYTLISKVTDSHSQELGQGNTPLSGVDSRVFHEFLVLITQKTFKGHSEVTRGHFHFQFQNPVGVPPTKFHPYPVNTSQVIAFMMSIFTFRGKRLLTPEGVAEWVSLTGGVFSRMSCSVWFLRKIDMPPLIMLRKMPISGLRGGFPKCT